MDIKTILREFSSKRWFRNWIQS